MDKSMGGKKSGYRLPLMLTREMQIAHDRLKVKLESADDFPVALQVYRLGLICYDVLSEDELRSMYHRKLITDDEAQFLLEEGYVNEDFRPVSKERIHQANEVRILNTQFGDVIKCWDDVMKASTKMHWIREAKKHPDIPNARRLLDIVKEVT